jgi:5-formyltetrahydrofolate cyclo-ligase
MLNPESEHSSSDRRVLRQTLLAARDVFSASPAFAGAQAALSRHLADVLLQLEPECLGLYWPIRAEFNAPAACLANKNQPTPTLALPFAHKATKEMHYRQWNGKAPAAQDECGIATSDGPPVLPDVVLVPCVGFTAGGYRLGYGGGYYDRWLAQHPHVTAIGVAWAHARISQVALAPQSHDQPLMLVVTEDGVVTHGADA